MGKKRRSEREHRERAMNEEGARRGKAEDRSWSVCSKCNDSPASIKSTEYLPLFCRFLLPSSGSWRDSCMGVTILSLLVVMSYEA